MHIEDTVDRTWPAEERGPSPAPLGEKEIKSVWAVGHFGFVVYKNNGKENAKVFLVLRITLCAVSCLRLREMQIPSANKCVK